jgi:hypothetical protein
MAARASGRATRIERVEGSWVSTLLGRADEKLGDGE